jgi:molecular chaperone GrpE
MADEHEIPVKVVDRRWWVKGNESAHRGADDSSRKPTFVEELERQLADRDKQVQELLSKYRQASQEFEEARARMRKDISRDAERNRREVIVSFLDVVDNLDRAIEAGRQAGSTDALLNGVEMVRRQCTAKLDGFGIRRIESQGEPFDPLLHEAVSTVPASDPALEGRVVGVVRPGYRIGDEILRPVLVAVATSSQMVD